MTRDEERIEQIEKFASKCYEDGERYSSFIAGAIWSDNNPVNVWHEASEKPRAKEWLLIQFGEDDYDVIRYVYADKKGDFFFATAGEWIMHNTGRKHIPRYMVVSL